ncbi:hypothetical protein Tco_1306856, partial [Tanacetum coccineum]
MRKDLQNNSQEHKAPRLKTSQEGSSKEFLRTQGSKTQDVTRRIHNLMTTPLEGDYVNDLTEFVLEETDLHGGTEPGRNVEELDLWLWDVGVGQEFTYEDELFFNNLCFNREKLSRCLFNPPNGAIVGKDLSLIDCYGYKRIDVTSKSVKKLVLSEYYSYVASLNEDYIDRIKINAPYISSLTIKGELFLQELVLLDVCSLIKVDLDYYIDRGFFEMTHKEIFRGLLESLDHVKDVAINDYCWE